MAHAEPGLISIAYGVSISRRVLGARGEEERRRLVAAGHGEGRGGEGRGDVAEQSGRRVGTGKRVQGVGTPGT